MNRSIARYLKRNRHRIVASVTGTLQPVFGHDRADAEATAFVDGLAAAFVHADTLGVLDRMRIRFSDWQRMGADSDRLLRVMLALVRAPSDEARPADPHWLHDVRPLLDLVPSAIVLVDGDDRVLAANRAFCALGHDLAETLAGLPLAELLVDADADAPGGASAGHARVALRTLPARPLLVERVPLSRGANAGALVMFTPDVGAAISEASLAELLEREKHQKEQFAALLTVSHAVLGTLDINTVLSTIAKQVRQVIQTDECTVFLFDEAEQVLKPVVCDATSYVDEMMAIRLRLGEGITGTVALTGRGEIVNDSEADPRAVNVPGTPPEQSSLMCVPLLGRERVVGVLTLTNMGSRGFQKEDLDLATLFAGQCSAAIENARLYDQTKRAYDELSATQSQLVQSAKLNALGEMAGGVAHDFNNILAAILGRTQLMLQTADEPEFRRQLQVIEQAALDGAQTVRRVQEFTRVRQDEHFETLDINKVLLDVVELTRPAWESAPKRRGIGIDVHLELAATRSTAGNASELREVFTNLILNAVDAMPRGGQLTVSTENGLDSIHVHVRDSGVGMDEETRSKIFDPFFTTKEIQGNGLGLSVAYGIVSRHRGTIEVHSEPGSGTLFTLTFPAGVAEPVLDSPDPDAPVPRMRVLVVDDEEAVLEVLGDMLIALDMEVTRALGGPAGVEAIRQKTFDAVFTDLGMPEVNGWDLAHAAKAARQETAVVLVTGWGFQLEEDAATARGVDLVMAKPFSWDDVEAVIRHIGHAPSRAA